MKHSDTKKYSKPSSKKNSELPEEKPFPPMPFHLIRFADFAVNHAEKWPQCKEKWSASTSPPGPLMFCAYGHLVHLMIQYSDDQSPETAEPAYVQLINIQSMLLRNANLEDDVIALPMAQTTLLITH